MKSERNDDLQCLRAIAILLVIMQHYRSRLPTPDIYAKLFDHFAFWPGVDIFFAISGFLICHSFLRDIHQTSSLREASITFWARRWGRLFPAVAFWSAASICIAAFVPSSPNVDVGKVATGALAAISGISNAYWVHCVQLGGLTCGNADLNGVTWSLSLEWQLYAVLTALICLIGARWAVATMLLAAAIMSLFPAPSFSVMWAFRPQAFALGALAFLALRQSDALPVLRLPRFIATVLLIAGVFVCITAPPHLPQPLVVPVIAAGALLCLLSGLSGSAYSGSAMLSPMIWIGERSYSIYLCHLPMLLVTREIMVRTVGLAVDIPHVLVAVAVGGTLIATCGELSFRFIEVPFQKTVRQALVRRRISRQSV
ncbi:acyltransferase family protein [Caballeronia humi]|uniref:Acyltransferase family protein n=1 Tax=Caballeronia humi TaxID=326474 RepID=A0A158GZS9_9BURK|nr:acyltransferase [Caballeronia humi]SAL37347.1 acyltransferase family protein [Caballeronia humi]